MLYWRFDTIPRQLPPTRTGPPSGRACASASALRSAASRSPRPASPNPPGIRMIDSAFPSASAATTSVAAGAGTETTARSTFSGSAATEGTHGTPSIAFSFGWTAQSFPYAMPSDCLRFFRMMRPGFGPEAEAPMTAALFGARREAIFARGRDARTARRAERRALPSAATHRPSAHSSRGLTSSSSRVGLPREFEGEKEKRRFLERVSSSKATASSSRGACACPLCPSKKIFSAGLFFTPAWRPCFTSPGRRITVVAPGAICPYHSVSSPPSPKTRTGPNAGSCLNERRASAAGVPEAGTSFSTTRIPASSASGARRETSDQIFCAAARTDAGFFLESEYPPTSLL